MAKIDDIRKKLLAYNGKHDAIKAIESRERIGRIKQSAIGQDPHSLIEAVVSRGAGTSFVDWVDASITRVTELYPEFIRILYRMTIVPAPGLETCALDAGARLYIDPSLKGGVNGLLGWTCGQLAYVIGHECLHWMEEHADRAQAMSATGDMANIAADLEIESILLEDVKLYGALRDRASTEHVRDWAHIRSPEPGGVWSIAKYASLPRGRTFEWYFDKLKTDAEQEAKTQQQRVKKNEPAQEGQPQQGAQGQGGQDADQQKQPGQAGGKPGGEPGGEPGEPGGEPGEPGGEPGPPSSGAQGEPQQGEADEKDEARVEPGSSKPWDGQPIQCQPHPGDHGSVVDGVAREYELPAPDGDKIPGVTPIEAEGIRREIAIAILEGSGRGAGSLGMRRLADRVLTVPPISWEARLSAVLQDSEDEARAGRSDYTWSRRARRQSAMPDFVIPGTESFTPSLVIVRDTSGSMNKQMLGAVNAHGDMVLMSLDLDGIHVVDCDGAAFSPKMVRSLSDFQPTGGGGTDMRLGISAALAIVPRPKTIMVFTDGDTPWSAEAPTGVRVVAVLVPGGSQSTVRQSIIDRVPSWMTTILVERETPTERTS